MTKNIRLNSRLTSPLVNSHFSRRPPRGLAMLRALRLRLAAEKYPRLHQTEFHFGK